MMEIHRQLSIKAFHIKQVAFADKFSYQNEQLFIVDNIKVNNACIDAVTVNIIAPYQHHVFVNNIMDVIPISSKVLGELGSGITHTFTGAYVLLTAADTQGKQFHNFGCSSGMLDEQMKFDQAGTPKRDDYLIHIDVLVKPGMTLSREAVVAVHQCADEYINQLRGLLKEIDLSNAHEKHVFKEKINEGKPKVVLLKQIGGQGAMHESVLLPQEPSSSIGGTLNLDIQSFPIILTLNQYRDGAIRAMT